MDSTLRNVFFIFDQFSPKKCETPRQKTVKGLIISHTTYISTRKTYSRAEENVTRFSGFHFTTFGLSEKCERHCWLVFAERFVVAFSELYHFKIEKFIHNLDNLKTSEN